LLLLDNCEIEGVSVINYGIVMAKMHGILERALSVFHICQVYSELRTS